MKSLRLGRYALCSRVAAAMLAGCGGSQPPIGAPGAIPQSRTIATGTDHDIGMSAGQTFKHEIDVEDGTIVNINVTGVAP